MSTGVEGLDVILGGGLPANRMHLLMGTPGTGKTTLALHFLRAGAARGERVLYVTLAETREELRQVAESHGWDLEHVTIRELSPSEEHLRQEQQYTILYPGEVEFSETMEAVLAEVEETKPTRVVFDSLSELRLLARDGLRYRHQVLALKQFFAGRQCTVLLLDNVDTRENNLESVAHGVLMLEQTTPQYGTIRRRIHIVKLRGSAYRGGFHDLEITTGGVVVYPRLVAAEHRSGHDAENGTAAADGVSSGLPGLDALLGDGLARGTSVLLLGPAGSGKSSLAAQYAAAAAQRGERSVVYIFDESRATLLRRMEGLSISLGEAQRQQLVTIEQLDPAQLSPGAFIDRVRRAVDEEGARIVVIDSLNGYLNAMAEERLVLVQLHELLTYLGQRGVLTIMTLAQHGLIGDRMQSPLDASYIADTVVLIRYFEAAGEVRQALSVVKKRTGRHERSIRELRFIDGLQVGEPLRDFHGVMTGTPRYAGAQSGLIGRDGD